MSLRYILTIPLFFTFSIASKAAYSDTIPRTKTLSRIKLTDNTLLYGYIVQASDSSISYIKKADWKKRLYMHRETLPAESIAGVTKNFRNGMTAGEGALWGGLSGVVAGFSIVLIRNWGDSDEDYDEEDYVFSKETLKLSLFLAGALGLIGMIVGLFSKKKDKMHYQIDGKRDNIRYNKIGLTF